MFGNSGLTYLWNPKSSYLKHSWLSGSENLKLVFSPNENISTELLRFPIFRLSLEWTGRPQHIPNRFFQVHQLEPSKRKLVGNCWDGEALGGTIVRTKSLDGHIQVRDVRCSNLWRPAHVLISSHELARISLVGPKIRQTFSVNCCVSLFLI